MMSLTNILTIDSLQYGEPTPKHIEKMSKGWGKLDRFDIEQFKSYPPPKNNSVTVSNELDFIQNINRDEDFIVRADDVDNYFREYIESLGYEYPEKYVKKLLDSSKPIILILKYYYNRPRPSDISERIGKHLDNFYLKTMGTPSYPSGHSTQGVLVSLALSDMFPKHKKELRKLGKEISYSRLMSKAHYPSDSYFGEQLGLALYRQLEKNNGR